MGKKSGTLWNNDPKKSEKENLRDAINYHIRTTGQEPDSQATESSGKVPKGTTWVGKVKDEK